MFPAGRGCRRRRASRGGARGRDLEGRGEETAADRVAYLGAAVVELAVVLAVAEDDGAGDVAHGASHALRVPGPAGDAISVRQIRGRGGYGARARCVARGRGGGGQGEVRARTLATFPNIADISVAAPRRASPCARVLWFTAESDAQRLPVNNARIDRAGAPVCRLAIRRIPSAANRHMC